MSALQLIRKVAERINEDGKPWVYPKEAAAITGLTANSLHRRAYHGEIDKTALGHYVLNERLIRAAAGIVARGRVKGSDKASATPLANLLHEAKADAALLREAGSGKKPTTNGAVPKAEGPVIHAAREDATIMLNARLDALEREVASIAESMTNIMVEQMKGPASGDILDAVRSFAGDDNLTDEVLGMIVRRLYVLGRL